MAPRSKTKKAATKKAPAKKSAKKDDGPKGMEKVIADADAGKIRSNIQGMADWVLEEFGRELDPADIQIVITGYKFWQTSEEAVALREEAAAEREEAAETRAAKKTTKKTSAKRTAKKSTAKKSTARKGRAKKVAEEEPEDAF